MYSINWALVQAAQACLDQPEEFLSALEIAKYGSLRFPKRRQEWLLGRYTAKHLVQGLPGFESLPLPVFEIHNMPDGAPFIVLPGQPGTPGCLTISHCEQTALCGFAGGQDLRIGADLEKIELRSRAFVEDYFTRVEHDLVESFPEGSRISLVNLIWSAKESMLKALGVGLHWDTRQVEVWQVDGLFPARPGNGEWNRMKLGDCQDSGRRWEGWWKSTGDFVLTLAACTTRPDNLQSIQLVEKTI
jgi:4'-phosphopantetheinyl transferase